MIIDGGVRRKLRDGSAIAGSIATMERLIKTAVKEAGLPIEDVARMVSEHTALIMGVIRPQGQHMQAQGRGYHSDGQGSQSYPRVCDGACRQPWLSGVRNLICFRYLQKKFAGNGIFSRN